MHEQLTFGSLFAGLGGFDLGLERAGLRCLWQCELDDYAVRVLERHWPAVARIRDVHDVTRASVSAVDVICGGFPCQDISVAGRGDGITGARSGLWAQMLRVTGELRPRYVLVENVAALLARGLGRVLGDLAALGYDAEWDCLPAAAFGAPHRRDRVFLVAYPGRGSLRDQPGRGDGPNGTHAPEPGHDGAPGPVADSDGPRPQGQRRRGDGQAPAAGGREDVADADAVRWPGRARDGGPRRGSEPQDGGGSLAHAQRPRPQGETGTGLAGAWRPAGVAAFRDRHPWPAEPDVGRVAHGVPQRVDRLRALGNALVPAIAQYLGEALMRDAYSQRWD